MDDGLRDMPRLHLLCVAATWGFALALAPPSVSLGDFLVQRAIQQQLYYSADLRNELMVGWLGKFRGHEHLDSTARGEGSAGFPGTYSATFSQLVTTPFPEYLAALGTEPESTVEVKIIKPQKFLSARERANPYLAKQGPSFEIYDEPIIPSKILTQVLVTAGALVETWDFHLGEVGNGDVIRVARDLAEIKTVPTAEMMRDLLLEEGGETVYSRFTQDEPMPLYAFDRRAIDRLMTLRALSMLIDEVTALTPETAFEAPYLRREAATEYGEDVNNELIMKRRRIRRETFEAAFVSGDELAKGAAAREAALFFLKDFCETYVPKLFKGDSRSPLQKRDHRPAPGMKEARSKDAGEDAKVIFEALWEYQEEAAYGILGGELVVPYLMGVRLRELRAHACAQARVELQDHVWPEIRSARLTYTDYTEEGVDTRSISERFLAASDEENYVSAPQPLEEADW